MQEMELNKPIYFLESPSMDFSHPEVASFCLKEKSNGKLITLEALPYLNKSIDGNNSMQVSTSTNFTDATSQIAENDQITSEQENFNSSCFVYEKHQRFHSPDNYIGDVQGPINKEPDEKLSTCLAQKSVYTLNNQSGSRINRNSTTNETSLSEPFPLIDINPLEQLNPTDTVESSKTGSTVTSVNKEYSQETNENYLNKFSISMPNFDKENKQKLIDESDSSFDSNHSATSSHKSRSDSKMNFDDCMVPRFELDDSSSSESKSFHNSTKSQDSKHDPEAFDEVEFNLTPKKNQNKHSVRHSVVSSPGNMNSYAFMHTYNNFPNNTKLQVSPSQFNLNTSENSKKNRRPWYSAFTNSYKQKNDEFRRLFKLSNDEHLLVDYSCALQKEILAHGRLYISLNYLCFHANIIGWETTLSIKHKEIRKISKDRTAKIIPNAITVQTETERYFFTTLASRDKTYTTLFRVWQIALADASMSNEEIKNIVKSSYGDDLGYDTAEEADDEFVNMLTAKSDNNLENKDIGKNNDDDQLTSSDMFNNLKNESKNGSNSSEASMFLQENVNNISSATEKLIKSSMNIFGHKHSSSYDASYKDNDDAKEVLVPVPNTTGVWLKRPISMLVSKPSTVAVNQSKLQQKSPSQQVNAGFIDPSQSVLKNSSNIVDQEKFMIDDNNNTRRSNNSEGRNSISESNVRLLQNGLSSTSNGSPASSALVVDFLINNLSASPVEDNSKTPESSSESNESELPETEIIMNYSNIKCSCDHQGKEMLNREFDFSVNYLFELMLGSTEFRQKYWESRKFGCLKVGAWIKQNTGSILSSRVLEYTVDLGALGKPGNTENQRILEYRPDNCIVIESESETRGVLYSDYFTVKNRFCLTSVSASRTRIIAHSHINYIMKPNFIVKSFIEKNTYSTIKDSFNYLEKHLPNSKQPATLPYHISAFTNNQTLLDKPSSLSTLRASTPSSSNNASTQNINLEGDLNNERSLKETKNYQKKALSSSGDKVCSRAKNSKQNLNFLQNSANEDEYNQINSAGSVNSLQPQLVPIQTFSFFKWKINVDTLVRIFIIAMICLMVINAMLYYKLRRIETLADGLRNDPTILEKISAIKNSCGSGQFSKPGHFNDQTLSNDLIGWRDVISNTLNVIQKMENSLKEWDKSLEKRQYLDRDYIPTKTNSINLNDQNSVKDDHSGQSKVDDL